MATGSIKDGDNNFEQRGVNLLLFQSIRDEAIKRNKTPKYWTINRIAVFLIGNHEGLAPPDLNGRWKNEIIDPNITLTHFNRLSLIDSLQFNSNLCQQLKVSYDQVVVIEKLCRIDLEKCTAYLKEDLKNIFAVVRAMDGGVQSFNVKIMTLIRHWIAHTARQMIENISHHNEEEESYTDQQLKNKLDCIENVSNELSFALARLEKQNDDIYKKDKPLEENDSNNRSKIPVKPSYVNDIQIFNDTPSHSTNSNQFHQDDNDVRGDNDSNKNMRNGSVSSIINDDLDGNSTSNKKKADWLQLKEDVGDNEELLKKKLTDYQVDNMKPAHISRLMKALKNLKT
eukprot:gene12770-17122_t